MGWGGKRERGERAAAGRPAGNGGGGWVGTGYFVHRSNEELLGCYGFSCRPTPHPAVPGSYIGTSGPGGSVWRYTVYHATAIVGSREGREGIGIPIAQPHPNPT